MKHLILAAIAIPAFLFSGCATKTRNVELDGMYVSESGMLAIGSVEVQAAPVGEEVTHIAYSEDTAWLSPSTKTHNIKIMMTGTNSVAAVPQIVASICDAFVATAPAIAQADAAIAATNVTSNKTVTIIKSATTATPSTNAAPVTVEASTNAVPVAASSSTNTVPATVAQ